MCLRFASDAKRETGTFQIFRAVTICICELWPATQPAKVGARGPAVWATTLHVGFGIKI